MKILSFDIGIKNLAYCILNLDSTNRFTIEEWDIINLDENRKICQHTFKNKQCSKSANYKHNDTYICSNHISKYTNEVLVENMTIKETIKCEHVVPSGKKCKNAPTSSILSQNYCQQHVEQNLKLKQKQNNPTKLGKQNCNKIPVLTLATTLCKKLNDCPNMLLVDEVIIENQPTLKNPTMKNIASYVFMYFIVKGVSNVRNYCPSNKLKIGSNDISENKIKDSERKIYVLTKTLGKKYCECLIKEFPKQLEFFNSHKKKDDLADCLIQGFHYMFSDNGISEYYQNLLKQVDG